MKARLQVLPTSTPSVHVIIIFVIARLQESNCPHRRALKEAVLWHKQGESRKDSNPSTFNTPSTLEKTLLLFVDKEYFYKVLITYMRTRHLHAN